MNKETEQILAELERIVMERQDWPRKSMTIDAIMDENGFYILINIWDDDEYLPMNWKHMKEMVNDKKTYFKFDESWP
jgi:hypothetical protein